MPANKYALLRYRIIDRCLTNDLRPFPTKEDLREACEEALYGSDGEHISISTIEKDLWAMRNEGELGFYAPIEYHAGNRGYHYTEENYSINDVSLNEEDLDAIQLAAQTLYQFRGIPMFNQYESAIEKIVSRLAVSPGKDESEPAFIQFEQSPSIPGLEWFEGLVRFIREREVVQLGYQKFGSDTPKTYNLDPLLLKEYRNRWYLIARDRGRDDIRTFGLERVVSLEPTGEYAATQKDFDPDTFFKYSIGITVMDETPQEVRIQVDQRQVPYLESQPLHPSQQKVEETEDHAVFSLEVLITFELISELLGMGGAVKVIKPNLLRNHLRTLAEQLVRNHK